jgi:hypothetical protein
VPRKLHEKVPVKKGPTIEGSSPLRGPLSAIIEATLESMPSGSWHIRALTTTGIELPASTVTIDPDTLKLVAEIPNPYEISLRITDLLVNLGDD